MATNGVLGSVEEIASDLLAIRKLTDSFRMRRDSGAIAEVTL